jgi:hypothetical protein
MALVSDGYKQLINKASEQRTSLNDEQIETKTVEAFLNAIKVARKFINCSTIIFISARI